MIEWKEQLCSLIDDSNNLISKIKPSDWYEQNMVMPRGSAYPGKFSFKLTPYWREPLDCLDPLHPAREVSIMKGAQLGGTAAVLNPIVGYTIANNPGNIMFLTGHSDLSDAAMLKIDHMIDNSGIRHLIVPSVVRKKNSRTGDTNKSKEFSGGDLKVGSVTNHNLLRQHDIMIMVVDDYDAAAMHTKSAGSTRELVQKRTSAYALKKKIYWVSSPQLKGASNIEDVFLLGDQRYYNVPCPKCGEFIVLEWLADVDGSDEDKAGIHWKLDKGGRVLPDSVGYICQKCGEFFDDSHKYEMNLSGMWVPKVQAMEKDHYSYHLSSLYAPPGMDNWAYYAVQYQNANPEGKPRNQKKHQTFLNVVLGETYEPTGETPKGSELQNNIRRYEIGTIPEKLSINEGNGTIVLITCAADLNGVVEDARLDYEIVAWSESGSSYSISHGSIGTFIPREGTKKIKVDRERWTYEHGRPNSVWPELDKILDQKIDTDTGKQMKIFYTGLDTGHYTNYAYHYVDNSRFMITSLKGDKEDKFIKFRIDVPNFKPARERGNLFLVQVGQLKDDLSELMKLKWDSGNEYEQPPGFMNFPTPSGGRYLFNNFFSHYESEHRVVDVDSSSSKWEKKSSNAQNHFWDVRIYNMVMRDILVSLVCKEMKIKNPTWKDYVDVIVKRS